MLARIKAILNRFADSQPALQDRDLPHASAALQLGDLITSESSSAQSAAIAAAALDATSKANAAQAAAILAASGDATSKANAAESAAKAFAPTVPGDWNTAPITVSAALDELAARVKALEP